MLGGAGFYRGTTVLVSGTPGSGKSSLSAHYLAAACARGERVLAFTYEESPDQVIRNMASIGLDLRRWVDQGLLRFIAARPSMYGLEMHLAVMLKAIDSFAPHSVIIDPISNLVRAGTESEAQTLVVRLLDFLKTHGITAILTHPTNDAEHVGRTDLAISSIIDTWILVQTLQSGGERNRTLYILKSRGMAHSNQIREFVITSTGTSLIDVYTGPDGVLTGAERASREAQARAETILQRQQIAQRERQNARRRRTIEAQITALREQLSEEETETGLDIAEAKAAVAQLEQDRSAMAKRRRADADRTSPLD
jgi:circadian clock protein KaiC